MTAKYRPLTADQRHEYIRRENVRDRNSRALAAYRAKRRKEAADEAERMQEAVWFATSTDGMLP